MTQSVLPLIWIIVVDTFETNDYSQVVEMFHDVSWVHVIKLKRIHECGYSHKNFAEAINEGFEYGRFYCKEKGFEFKYVGKIDALSILSKKYFETLIHEMEKNPNLAITCGIEKYVLRNTINEITPIRGLSLSGFNDIRLYNRFFFRKRIWLSSLSLS